MLPTVGEILETLFDFGDPSLAAAWEAVGDPVMGGRSTGRLLAIGAGWVAFTGTVRLDDGGGFASVRSAPGAFDLTGREGVLVEVRGDGRVYKLSLRTDPWFDAVAWQVRFPTRAGEREVHRFPFPSFRATWRGRPVPGAPLLEPGRVASFGLVVGDQQAGDFRLELAAIRAYGGSRRAR
ncbi:MAG TPA: CIA30 family protein [Anaeromyxobacteraceae bacterium]|nr:CIA30 family protein [Anaeromyxobacteraceae bacterium]